MSDYSDPFMNEPVIITEAAPRKHDIFDDIDPPRPTILQAALDYIAAGLSVVPCVLPGKYPPLPWMTYQGEIAPAEQVTRWYTDHPQWGVGFACGEVSGGLEVIDLDGGAFADQYVETVKKNVPGLIDRLVIEQSPSGGKHYAYRCADVAGNTALAKTTAELPGHKRGVDGLTTLIETRGQGGYIVVYPTRGYTLQQGDWRNVPSITVAERDLLWSCAALFDESDKATPQAPDTYQSKTDIKPPKDNDDFADLMQRHGWTLEKRVKDHEEWRRPGKESGVSATWNYIDNSLYIFSSNAAPFQANHRYTFAQIRALLEPECVPLHERALTEKYYNTDMGNGKRFVARYQEQFKHSDAWGWLRWNGYKWERNADKLVMDAARHTAQMIFAEAAEGNQEQSKAIGKWAIQSQSKSKLDAMLYLASSEVGIRATPADFDADHYTLNCLNGIVDLRTGDFSKSDPSCMLSKSVNAKFDPSATCPRWLSFLDRIMEGNDDMIRFLQRAIGYSLTGSVNEQCFFLNYGTGANGKSVFLETIRSLLNDYAAAAEFSAFLATQSESVRNDIAALAGARFVSANESGADKRLSESIIKAITGGDTISARFLFKEYFEFRPQFKVWMATNHKPVIKDTDNAIWRRVRLVPFNVTIPEAERDQKLTATLRDEFSGILNWAIEGCLQWQANGLGAPLEVTEATKAYRNEQDALNAFIDGYCIKHEAARFSASKMCKLYCEITGEKVSARAFNTMMTDHGWGSEHSRTGTQFVGIGPLDFDDRKDM
jgi:P4 family phage/plasmid primase-like protien